jgi:DNA primase
MRFPPALLDEIRARLPVSQVVGRKVALKRAGREYKGLSPFKTERTPSFTVNDQKGFYHCFSSGEHGDIFKFVMRTEGLSFFEAVERLAGEAGVPLPKESPRIQEEVDRRARLQLVVEAACQFYIEQLARPAGREALRYAEGRGLTRNTIDYFRLGYAPPGRHTLKEHLAAKGFTPEEMQTSGMLIHGTDIPVSYDRFRNRLMFPITDLKDRVIAFGGRALEKEQQPKYLNSPETPLFHKGALLFNAAKARSAAHKQGQIIVVEGYMDAIALSQAGFAESVAPLGTALTADQLALLWRLVPEPTLCFDGDVAGRKAAFRAVETALPFLSPGRSLKFAFLPDGLDPDDLVRREGPEAMHGVLARARPFVEVLWEREWGSGNWSTPERRARFEMQIKALIARIEHGALRAHYEQEIRDRLAKAFGGSRRQGGGERAQPWRQSQPARQGRDHRPQPYRKGDPRPGLSRQAGPGLPPSATSSLKQSRLVAGDRAQAPNREALLLRTLLNHPWLVDDHAELVAELPFSSRMLAELRDALLRAHAVKSPLDREELRDQLRSFGQDKALSLLDRTLTHRSDRFAEPSAPQDMVELGWRHTLALHELQVELRRKIAAAEQAWRAEESEEAYMRLRDLTRRLHEAEGREAQIDGYMGGSSSQGI